MKKKLAIVLSLMLVFTTLSASALTLRMGSKGTNVTTLQNRLKELGYFSGAVTGKYEYSTYESVWTYQRDNKLKADGIAGKQTLTALGLAGDKKAAEGIEYAARGENVKALQNALKKLGFYKGTVDGVYGYSTWEAVWQFQKANGLYADGIAGPKTLTKLSLTKGSGYTYNVGAKKGIEYGAEGSSVTRLQKALKKLGYYKGSITGKYNYGTWEAVWQFQKANGMYPTGDATASVLALLDVTPSTGGKELPKGKALDMGAKGDAVKSVQKKLVSLGYLKSASGTYDYATWEAVWKFQRDHELYADGVVGTRTWNMLMN